MLCKLTGAPWDYVLKASAPRRKKMLQAGLKVSDAQASAIKRARSKGV